MMLDYGTLVVTSQMCFSVNRCINFQTYHSKLNIGKEQNDPNSVLVDMSAAGFNKKVAVKYPSVYEKIQVNQ